jgi:carbamate kinase
VRDGDASVAAQREQTRGICAQIADFAARGWRVVITHGNGPQVGAALLRSERAADEAYPIPLDVCVAATQGETGFLLAEAFGAALRDRGMPPRVAAVVTAVVVSPDDPAFQDPSKPIGPFYPRDQADARARAGWRLVEQPPRGWRRVVPSPEPLEIPEEAEIRTLLESGSHVITLGGGGVPVVREGLHLVGVDAVVDKDSSSALLANNLGVDLLVILTDVDGIYLDFATPNARRLEGVRADELRVHMEAGHFAPGSMEPKAEAVLRFIEAGGARAVVSLPEHMADALAGRTGTYVYGERAWTGSAR